MSSKAVIGVLGVTLALALSGCIVDAGYDAAGSDDPDTAEVALELTAGQGWQGGVDEDGEGEADVLKGDALVHSGEPRQGEAGPGDVFVALEPDPDPWTPGHGGDGDNP